MNEQFTQIPNQSMPQGNAFPYPNNFEQPNQNFVPPVAENLFQQFGDMQTQNNFPPVDPVDNPTQPVDVAQSNDNKNDGPTPSEKIYKAWFSRYFLKDFGKLEKRILDWWVEEGFFGISNIQKFEDSETIDFMLRVGLSAYDEIGDATEEYKKERMEKIVAIKGRQGWDVYSAKEVEGLHVLRKTQKNIDKVQQLLMSNIRSFKVENFEYCTLEGVEYIKSLTVRIYRKKQQP